MVSIHIEDREHHEKSHTSSACIANMQLVTASLSTVEAKKVGSRKHRCSAKAQSIIGHQS